MPWILRASSGMGIPGFTSHARAPGICPASNVTTATSTTRSLSRTPLVAWARARSVGGAIVLRIEDLDPPRVVPGATDAIVRDLAWLGLDFSSDPPSEPFLPQSARTNLYVDALSHLRAGRWVFEC